MVGFFLGGGRILEQPDKLPLDLSGVINYHPGKGPGRGLSVTAESHRRD